MHRGHCQWWQTGRISTLTSLRWIPRQAQLHTTRPSVNIISPSMSSQTPITRAYATALQHGSVTQSNQTRSDTRCPDEWAPAGLDNPLILDLSPPHSAFTWISDPSRRSPSQPGTRSSSRQSSPVRLPAPSVPAREETREYCNRSCR